MAPVVPHNSVKYFCHFSSLSQLFRLSSREKPAMTQHCAFAFVGPFSWNDLHLCTVRFWLGSLPHLPTVWRLVFTQGCYAERASE